MSCHQTQSSPLDGIINTDRVHVRLGDHIMQLFIMWGKQVTQWSNVGSRGHMRVPIHGFHCIIACMQA